MYWSVVFYCLNLLLILSSIHTTTNSERFYSWRSNGKKKRTNLRLQDLTARKFEATRHKNHPKTRIQDQSKTLLRLRDQAKIFFDPHFSSYHSIPLTVHSFTPPPTTPTVNTLFTYKKQRTKATTILQPEMFHPRGEGQTRQSIIRVVQSLNLLYTTLDRKGTPFVYLPLTSLELCIPCNYCKGTLFKIWMNHKTRTFFTTFFTPIKCIC